MYRLRISDWGLRISGLVSWCLGGYKPANQLNDFRAPNPDFRVRKLILFRIGGMKMKTLLGSLLLFIFTLAGTELTGKWTGSFDVTGPDGETKKDHAFMNLKQNGDELTGTA